MSAPLIAARAGQLSLGQPTATGARHSWSVRWSCASGCTLGRRAGCARHRVRCGSGVSAGCLWCRPRSSRPRAQRGPTQAPSAGASPDEEAARAAGDAADAARQAKAAAGEQLEGAGREVQDWGEEGSKPDPLGFFLMGLVLIGLLGLTTTLFKAAGAHPSLFPLLGMPSMQAELLRPVRQLSGPWLRRALALGAQCWSGECASCRAGVCRPACGRCRGQAWSRGCPGQR